MRPEQFPPNLLEEVMHVTAFIGLQNGETFFFLVISYLSVNAALVLFALRHLPKLRSISFRKAIDEHLAEILIKFGFEYDHHRSPTLALRGSCK